LRVEYLAHQQMSSRQPINPNEAREPSTESYGYNSHVTSAPQHSPTD
jgi:hypothetical protein